MRKTFLFLTATLMGIAFAEPRNSMLAANESEIITDNGLHPIPNGAIQVEYLESTGSQIIWTGIFIETNDVFSVSHEVCFNSEYVGVQRQLQGFSGNRRGYWGVSKSGKYEIGTYQSSVVAGNWNEICFEKDSANYFRLWIDGVNVLSPKDTIFLDRGEYRLFAYPTFWCHMKQGIVTILLQGELVRLFIPIRIWDGTEWVGCLFDRVSGELFFNQGTGDFIIGPDL